MNNMRIGLDLRSNIKGTGHYYWEGGGAPKKWENSCFETCCAPLSLSAARSSSSHVKMTQQRFVPPPYYFEAPSPFQ